MERLDCDLALLMLHGEFGEDGTVQAILERRGIAYTGSDAPTSARAMNKDACKRLFVENGIPTPRWVAVDDPDRACDSVLSGGLRLPFFVKPNCRGSSVGVGRVDTLEQLPDAVTEALNQDSLALVEEMVAGRELTVGWLDGRVLPTVELVADGTFYDYRAKYVSEATRYICPADLEPETHKNIDRYVQAVADIIGVRDVSRVDVMLGDSGPNILEINTLPGFTTHSLVPRAAAAAGLALPQLCMKLVEMAASRLKTV